MTVRALSSRVCLLAVLAGAGLAWGATAAAAIDWQLPAQVVSAPGEDAESTDTPAALIDGAALHVYRVRDGADTFRVVVRRQEATGAFGVARSLSPPGLRPSQPRVFPDPRGGAVAIWGVGVADGDDRVQLARLGSDGAPAGPVLDVVVTPGVGDPGAVVLGDGTVVVAWRAFLAVGQEIIRVRRVPPTGPPGPVVDLTPISPSLDSPVITHGADGIATVAWGESDGSGGSLTVVLRRLGPDGPPGPRIIPHPAGTQARNVALAPAPGGATHVTWTQGATTDPPAIVYRLVAADGGLGPATTPLSDPGIDASFATMAPLRDGGAVIGWVAETPTVTDDAEPPVFRRVSATGGRGPSLTVTPFAGTSSELRIAGSPDGSAVAIWRRHPGGPSVLEAARIRPDDTLGTSTPISAFDDIGDELGVTVLRDGRAVAAWDRFEDGAPDPAPGTVEAAISAPTLFVPGPPVGVTALPGDGSATVAWSPPASDGGLPVTSFTATARPGGASCTTAATTCAIGGLQNGVAHTVTVTATNGLGAGVPSQASAPFTPGAPLPAVRLTGVRVVPASVVRGRPAQTTRRLRIRATLNRPASLRVVFERRAPGLRRGRACVAPTPALRRARARVCTRFVRAGVVRRAGRTGVNTITITRLRVAGRTLAVGRHRVTVIAAAPGSPIRRASRPLTVRPATR